MACQATIACACLTRAHERRRSPLPGCTALSSISAAYGGSNLWICAAPFPRARDTPDGRQNRSPRALHHSRFSYGELLQQTAKWRSMSLAAH
jgi:hypothetical protein